jgi:hypothetical protein
MSHPIKLSLLLMLFAVPAVSASSMAAPATAPAQRYYVDPRAGRDDASGSRREDAFQTLPRAQRAAREAIAGGASNVEVMLGGGEYAVREPLRFGPADAGGPHGSVVYAAVAGERPIVAGGIDVTGWTTHDAERGILRAVVPPDVQTRSLFVNGVRATRARSLTGLNDGKVVENGQTCLNLEMLEWKNPSDVELVYRAIWTNPRVGVASIVRDGDRVRLVMDQPGWMNARGKGITSVKIPWFVENAYELLDQPGEWYLDRSGVIGGTPNTLFYKPQPWEDMKTARVVVPVAEDLFVVQGASLDAPVQNLAFRGIAFRHSTWLRPGTEFGLPDAQNNVMRENKSKGGEFTAKSAAITVKYAQGIAVEQCTFDALGGIGVSMYAGTKDSRIEGCGFRDIAANGIQIGDYHDFENPASENFSFPEDPRVHIVGIRIANNYLTRCGAEYRSSCAIALAFVRDSVVAHNEIHNVPYSGMHIGWGWERAKRTLTGNLRIESNLVRNTMVELADGGCFYTLGRSDDPSRPNIMTGNVARQARYGQGYYLDECSQFWQLSDNLAEQISDYNLKVNGLSTDISVTRLFAGRERNTIAKVAERIEVGPTITPAEDTSGDADRIRAAAGLEKAHQTLRIPPADVVVHEAEDAVLSNGALATSPWKDIAGYSGMGYVASLDGKRNAQVRFNVHVSKPGRYRVVVRYQSHGSDSVGWKLAVGDVAADPLTLPATTDPQEWGAAVVETTLVSGENAVTIEPPAGVSTPVMLDRIEVMRNEP